MNNVPVELIDAMLVNTSNGRHLFSVNEVQDMLLDLRQVISPAKLEAPDDSEDDAPDA